MSEEPIDETQAFHDDVKTLVRQSCRALKCLPYRSAEYDALSEAIANVEPWFETDDPVANGWVDQHGRP